MGWEIEINWTFSPNRKFDWSFSSNFFLFNLSFLIYLPTPPLQTLNSFATHNFRFRFPLTFFIFTHSPFHFFTPLAHFSPHHLFLSYFHFSFFLRLFIQGVQQLFLVFALLLSPYISSYSLLTFLSWAFFHFISIYSMLSLPLFFFIHPRGI
jgi:hypothetical protein